MKYSLSVITILVAVLLAHAFWPQHKNHSSDTLKVAGCIFLTAKAYEDAGEVVKKCELQTFSLNGKYATATYKVVTDQSRYTVRVGFHWGWAASDYNVQ